MSYILDALRKADAERERDPARGIHAQPLRPGPDTDARSKSSWIVLLAGVAGAGVLATGAWLWAGGQAVPTAPVAVAPREAPPVVAALPPPAATVPVAPATPAMEVLPPAPPPTPVAVIKAAAAPARSASAALSAAPTVAAPAVPAAPAASSAAAVKAAAPVPDKLPSLAELPSDVQRELPKLVVTGGVYSDNPAQRMLVINGQVFNEGGEPAAGVLLEQIRPRTAVLKFRNTRYSVAY